MADKHNLTQHPAENADVMVFLRLTIIIHNKFAAV